MSTIILHKAVIAEHSRALLREIEAVTEIGDALSRDGRHQEAKQCFRASQRINAKYADLMESIARAVLAIDGRK